MKEGSIVLARLPQVAGYEKNRPCLILRELPPYGDVLVCGISSQIQHGMEGFDEFISYEDPDFQDSGLLVDSVIRLGFLAVLPKDRVLGTIGAIAPARHLRLCQRLAAHLYSENE
ncbi:MAG: type II toxin-antitoxin system PemK/MazF family toxin [Verrucomicrobia bacterium]|nr:type II toxin-antitoxin system PemK/MazF family toxin [Verrucomicrobiota bacterium]MCH8510814.1 type II toxin-antitoxin system PemK/MazF family toxin [Kiritimatiellia bacterium]